MSRANQTDSQTEEKIQANKQKKIDISDRGRRRGGCKPEQDASYITFC